MPIFTNSIEDKAGTGAPSFTHGLDINGLLDINASANTVVQRGHGGPQYEEHNGYTTAASAVWTTLFTITSASADYQGIGIRGLIYAHDYTYSDGASTFDFIFNMRQSNTSFYVSWTNRVSGAGSGGWANPSFRYLKSGNDHLIQIYSNSGSTLEVSSHIEVFRKTTDTWGISMA